MLWGKSAQEKCANFLVDDEAKKHLVLKASHPSPYSAYNGFFGCKHFSKANAFLIEKNIAPINWQI
jgi:uracil-DNA glycosylase